MFRQLMLLGAVISPYGMTINEGFNDYGYNHLEMNDVVIDGDIQRINTILTDDGTALTSVFNVHYEYTFDIRFETYGPMYHNYILIKKLAVNGSNITGTNTNYVYAEYEDDTYYYNYTTPVEVHPSNDNYLEMFTHFNNTNNVFSITLTTALEVDDLAIQNSVIYQNNTLLRVRNDLESDYYGFDGNGITFDNTYYVSSDFSAKFAQLLELNNVLMDNVTSGYDEGFSDGYLQGTMSVDSSNGVFGLVATAFNSVSNFLSYRIAPNFTIGMLISVPIVAGIVFVIFKMAKG